MQYKEALKACRKVGTAHAQGDPLRAMYAGLIALQHGGAEAKYYEWLRTHATGDEQAIAGSARELMRDRAKAWDALMEVPNTPKKEAENV